MNSKRSKFFEEKIDMSNLLNVELIRKRSSIAIDIDSSRRSGISSENLSLNLSDYNEPDDFSRPRSSLNYYPTEEIFITNMLGKPKRLKDNILYLSHIRFSNFTPDEKRNKTTASSDSELHKKMLSPKKRLPNLLPRRSTVHIDSPDIAENINNALEVSGQFHTESISSSDLMPPQQTNNRDMKIFWITIVVLIIYSYFSRLMYSLQQYN